MQRRKFIFSGAALAAIQFGPSLSAQNENRPIVLKNAKILTVTNGNLEGSVVIQNGVITEIGDKVTIPGNAEVFDVGGQYLMPGIIDCHSHIAAESINEGSVSVSSMVGIDDVFDNEDVSIFRALAGGVTTANILHGSANAIGGKNVVMKMRWGKTGPEMIFEGAKPGIKFALGENPKRRGGGNAFGATTLRYPATRMGVEDVIRESFNDAKQYKQTWDDYRARTAKGERMIPPRRDLKLEPLVEVLEGKRLVHAHCYRADEILMLLRVAEEFGFKIKTLQHVLEGYKVAKEIKAHGAGASTFSDWWSYKMEAYDATPYNAAILVRAGVVTSLNSDSDELMRHLNQEAAKTIRYGGLTEQEALALITINPAKQLEIDDKVGSIEKGKVADLVIYDKHPLSNFAKVQRVMIDGKWYFERDKALSDVDASSKLRTDLFEKQKGKKDDSERKGPPDGAPGRRRPQGEVE